MVDQCIAEIDSGLCALIIVLRESQNLRFIELRLHERDIDTRQLSPTKWAIGLDGKMLSELKAVLEESYDDIQKWCGPREVNTVENVRIDMAAQTEAGERAARMTHKIDLRNSAWNGPTFFKSRSEGARVVIDLNGNHSKVSQITSPGPSGSNPRHMLSTILAAYHDAKNRFLGPENVSARKFFDAFEYEWGVILGRYTETCA